MYLDRLDALPDLASFHDNSNTAFLAAETRAHACRSGSNPTWSAL